MEGRRPAAGLDGHVLQAGVNGAGGTSEIAPDRGDRAGAPRHALDVVQVPDGLRARRRRRNRKLTGGVIEVPRVRANACLRPGTADPAGVRPRQDAELDTDTLAEHERAEALGSGDQRVGLAPGAMDQDVARSDLEGRSVLP